MCQWRLRGRFVSLGLWLAMLLVFVMPVGVAADTTPVTANTPVSFTGTGFAPNESLVIYETGSDGVQTPLSGVQSDGNGAFAVSVMFPSAGQWTVTAHSIVTGRDVVGTYTVSTTPSTTTITPPSNGTTATGTSAGIGVPVTFTGTGFDANENISVWETGPDTIVTPQPSIQADTTGTFTDSVSFPTAGQWQVTAQGLVSGHKIIASFAVGTTGGASSPVTTAPIGGAGFSGTPASIGVAVTFSGTGFNGNELISLWTTAPDTTTVALIGTRADGIGGFTDEVTFPSVGNWQVTAQGHDSAHQVIGRFTVTDPSSTATTASSPSSTFTSPYANVPAQVTSGTNVTFTATGFNAGENVAVWTTAPDATTTALASVSASSTGRATVTTSFGSVGLWQITLQGHDSTHKVIVQYQVTAPA